MDGIEWNGQINDGFLLAMHVAYKPVPDYETHSNATTNSKDAGYQNAAVCGPQVTHAIVLVAGNQISGKAIQIGKKAKLTWKHSLA